MLLSLHSSAFIAETCAATNKIPRARKGREGDRSPAVVDEESAMLGLIKWALGVGRGVPRRCFWTREGAGGETEGKGTKRSRATNWLEVARGSRRV
jgi:hypothetical protein